MSYCRGCRRETEWTRSGGQNGSRPRSDYFRCVVCGFERVALADIDDVVGVAVAVVAERRRPAAGDIYDENAKLDWDDATAHVTAELYRAYVDWDPARNPSFRSHGMWKARCALTDWFRDELGRDTPKALAWAYSIDALADDDGEEDGEGRSVTIGAVAAMAEASLPHAIVVVEDEETARALREIALPIAMGFSNAEVGAMHGQTEAWVKGRLKKLRAAGHLREIPA